MSRTGNQVTMDAIESGICYISHLYPSSNKRRNSGYTSDTLGYDTFTNGASKAETTSCAPQVFDEMFKGKVIPDVARYNPAKSRP